MRVDGEGGAGACLLVEGERSTDLGERGDGLANPLTAEPGGENMRLVFGVLKAVEAGEAPPSRERLEMLE
jgi:hypothetical protein